jgi:hypothetical protein
LLELIVQDKSACKNKSEIEEATMSWTYSSDVNTRKSTARAVYNSVLSNLPSPEGGKFGVFLDPQNVVF